MTLMRSISKLTTSVDRLADATNLTKADLDAKVSAAEAEIIAAQAELLAIETARDEASAHAADAATHLATVQADVTYQGIEAVLAAKAVNAFDVFVYDTSRDSDGGAWRKRCQHTSWYNEPLNTATRGARREFPAVAVLVIDAEGLSIYDADDPALPLWMFFQASFGVVRLLARGDNGMLRAVSALNGQIVVASGGSTASVGYDGISIFDFVADTASRFSGSGSNYVNPALRLGRRNTSGYPAGTNAARVIANRDVRQVAMTVLPDAPVDPATSLPVPTIAVATVGGVSVIKDTGSVVSIAHSDVADVLGVWLRHDLLIYNAVQFVHARKIPTENIAAGPRWVRNSSDIWFAPRFISSIYSGPSFHLHPTGAGVSDILQIGQKVFLANSDRLNRAIVSDVYGQHNALANFTTSDYNTGWMLGNTKGAFLSDTKATSLVAAEHLSSDAWTLPSGWSFEDGVLSYDGTGIQNSRAFVPIALPPGDVITVTFYVTSKTGTGSIGVGFGNSDAGTTISAGPTISGDTGLKTWTLTSIGSTATLYFQVIGNAAQTFSIEGMSVRRSDADRSVNANGLIVNGTVQRHPVAEGAELVAYSGSNSNYLFRDFVGAYTGHSIFALIGWYFGGSSGSLWQWHEVAGGGTSNAFLDTYVDITNKRFRLIWQQRAIIIPSTDGDPIQGGWYQIALCFTGNGQLKFYQNGRLVKAYGNVPSVALHEFRTISGTGCRMALLRLTETIPTPDQIAKIYEDEKRLFQPGAKCTLFGTSNAVTALAHDSKTNLLHVGTSQGRSVFDGLVRVDHTETPVATAISAVNGLIVER